MTMTTVIPTRVHPTMKGDDLPAASSFYERRLGKAKASS